MQKILLWICFAATAAAIVEGYYFTPAETYDPYYPEYFGHPWEYFPQLDWHSPYSPVEGFYNPIPWDTQYMNYIAPSSLISYIPVRPGSYMTPNVVVGGQGYSTNRYVAPSMVKKYLAMNPR
ncbi:uncharacterized protein LOC129727980 [Wyeomyia smithii]|uniref:uncharacterized protein LOC129727980 n=1 Tax=Wyeomyia smithii TaxID=174621 RepID=UPI002467CC05|nr:uncharacterized protein LOC129727980 [Wyeomyia smithii]